MPGVGVGVRLGMGTRRRLGGSAGVSAGVSVVIGVGDSDADTVGAAAGEGAAIGRVVLIGSAAGTSTASAVDGGSAAPTVTLTSPAASSVHIKETALTITASGACTDSTSVELFASVGGGAYASWGSDATVSGGTWEVVRTIQAGDVGSVNLRATATGAGGSANSSVVAVTVRNWTPADFGADIVVGYVATDVTLNGSYVTAFSDQGPNGKDMAQATESAQGTYQATCAVLNNRPAVAINADWYSHADVEQADGNRTIFFVLVQDAKDATTVILLGSKTGVFYYYTDSTTGTGQQGFYDGGNRYCGNETGIAGAVSHAALFDGTGGLMELHNRTGKINSTTPQPYTSKNWDANLGLFSRHDGGSNNFNGDFAALYVIDHVASAAELALWFGWSAREYGELG